MKKEFKTPAIEIRAISAEDSIMQSADRILETGGVKKGYTYTIDDSEIYREYKYWQDLI